MLKEMWTNIKTSYSNLTVLKTSLWYVFGTAASIEVCKNILYISKLFTTAEPPLYKPTIILTTISVSVKTCQSNHTLIVSNQFYNFCNLLLAHTNHTYMYELFVDN